MKCPNCSAPIGVVEYGGWSLDVIEGVLKQAPDAGFTQQEVDFVATLLAAKGRPLTRMQIGETICVNGTPRVMEIAVTVVAHHVRQKLGKIDLVGTERKIGYFAKGRKSNGSAHKSS